jgi:PAS domain S-box-containing protein
MDSADNNNSPKKILIVEDEKIVALDLKRSLLNMGYQVTMVVDSGERAVKSVEENETHLVLMDIGLKGEMNGIEAARIIRAACDVPVVYLTAYADDQTLKDATVAVPHGFLLKPFEERELKTTIEVALVRHKMELELRESQERFREIFQQNTDAIILLKCFDFSVIDLNPAAVKLFNYTPEELAQSIGELFPDQETYREFKNKIHRFQENEEDTFFQNCRLHRKDRAEIICQVRANVIKLQETGVLYCVFHDITEQTKIEEEARKLQEKLIHANRMTSLGTLASGLAHEINNPNNFIMSNTQIIQRVWEGAVDILQDFYREKGDFSLGGLSFPEVHELVPQLIEATIEGSRRIKHITDNLREFSRPGDARLYGVVSINKVLKFSISMLNNQIKKYTDSFYFNPGEDIPPFQGNSQQMEQVFINLIQNALQALPQSRVSGVYVSSDFDKNTQSIVVTVTDEGVGMNEKILDRITDPFFTTKQDQGGTGLGLYISYSILKAHHGVLEFQSKPGKGTTAAVKIPLCPGGPMEKNHE